MTRLHFALLLALIVITAISCSNGSENTDSPSPSASVIPSSMEQSISEVIPVATPSPTPSSTPCFEFRVITSEEEALRADAEHIAADLGITLEEAMKIIEEGISAAPPGVIEEYPTPEVTYRELRGEQIEIDRLLRQAGFPVTSSVNMDESTVELYVTDNIQFEATLKKADITIPERVVAVQIEVTPPKPFIHFPQLRLSGESMDALMGGTLVIRDGYLRVTSGEDDPGHLIVWQSGYFLHDNDGTIEVVDKFGQVVDRVGEEVCMGGGELPYIDHLRDSLLEPLPEQIEGPYWIQGGGMRLSLNPFSELFTLDLIPSDKQTFYFLRIKPILDDWAVDCEPITCEFIACYDTYCYNVPRLKIGNYPQEIIPLWPAGYTARVQNGKLEILNAAGHVVARDGEEIQLHGSKFAKDRYSEDIYFQLQNELPCGSTGPFWLVSD